MNKLKLNDSTHTIMWNSIYLYAEKNKSISFGKECISLDKYRDQKNKRQDKTGMDYFLLSKNISVEENVLFTAKSIYMLLGNKPKHIDQLFLDYASKQKLTINLNIERVLYLALTFLFALGKLKIKENMIVKLEGDIEL